MIKFPILQIVSTARVLRTEMPVLHLRGKQLVHGVVDLYIETENERWVIDYKTVPLNGSSVDEVIKRHGFAVQLAAYADAVQAIWHGNGKICLALLLTEVGELVELSMGRMRE